MEEVLNSGPDAPAGKNIGSAKKQAGWREYLESDEAVRFIYLVFGFFAILLIMSMLQFQTEAICCGDWDGYYHIRWSQLLWENLSQGKWLPTFEWLPLTVLNPQDYNDHHFLFHLLQIPFLWFFEPVMAAKVAAVFYATLAVFSVYWLIYRYKIGHQLIWLAAILTCANSFYFRMNMAKAPPLTIIFSVVGVYLLFERKYIWLLPLMFAFVWTYSLFPLLWIAAIIWTLIIAWNERVFEWRPITYTTAGMIAGNIINPYFPNNLILFYEHAATKIKVGSDFAVAVGGEWYPYTGMELLLNFPIALLAMLIGYILFMPKNAKLPEKATFFLIFTTLLLAAQFRSKRFAEYFPPFAILFAAFSWQAFKKAQETDLPEDFRREIEPYLDVAKPSETQAFWQNVRKALLWFVALALVGWLVFNLRGINFMGYQEQGLIDIIRNNEDADKYRRSMEWATGVDENGNENIPAGEIIFNCTWDDFPKLFFYNTKHRYVYGLDPNYLFSENPELYKLVMDITAGKTDDAAPVIREKFGSRFIFADAKENDQMIAKMLESGWVDIVYEDDEARIIRIRDEKGDPPGEAAAEDAPPTPEELKQLEEEERAANANEQANVSVEEEQ